MHVLFPMSSSPSTHPLPREHLVFEFDDDLEIEALNDIFTMNIGLEAHSEM